MTIQQVMETTGALLLNPQVDTSREVEYGYSCDLLSWVMSHGAAGTAWITVMTHMNAIAVATLLDFACLIVPEGSEVADTILQKATEEGVPVLASPKTAFELSGQLFSHGITAPVRV